MAKGGLNLDSATFNSSNGNTTIVFRNTGQETLENFTVTARLEDGSFEQKSLNKSIEPAEIATIRINSTSKPDMIRVDSQNLNIGTEIDNSEIKTESTSDETADPTGPTASASDNVSSPETGQIIEFDGSSSTSGDASISSYDWDVDGDGDYEKSGETVTHSYSSAGTKDVELNVTDSNNLYDSDSLTVDVQSGINTVVYDFEEGPEIWDNTEFTNTTTRSYSGSASLDIVAQSSSDTDDKRLISGELGSNFSSGDSISIHSYGTNIGSYMGFSGKSFDEKDSSQTLPTSTEAISLYYQAEYDDVSLFHVDKGSKTTIDEVSPGTKDGEWVETWVNYKDDSTMSVRMVDSSGTEFFSSTFNPNNYTSIDSWGHFFLGAKNYDSGAGYADDIEIKYN